MKLPQWKHVQMHGTVLPIHIQSEFYWSFSTGKHRPWSDVIPNMAGNVRAVEFTVLHHFMMLNQASEGRCCCKNNAAASPQVCIAFTEHLTLWKVSQAGSWEHPAQVKALCTAWICTGTRHCARTFCQRKKLSAKSWWEQGEEGFELSRQWESPGRSQPHTGPPPDHPSLPQCLKPIFQVKHLIPSSGKASRIHSRRQLCLLHAPAGGRGKFLLLITVIQLWQPAAPKRSPGENQSSWRSFRQCSRGVLIGHINASCCTAEAGARTTSRKLLQLFLCIPEFHRT